MYLLLSFQETWNTVTFYMQHSRLANKRLKLVWKLTDAQEQANKCFATPPAAQTNISAAGRYLVNNTVITRQCTMFTWHLLHLITQQ